MDIRKILVWFLLLAAMVFLCLRLIFIPSYASSLQYKGETITIIRDQYNVPHVKALSGSGALYGLGYATAEDRLFQMYIKKMIAEGRLSEIFGNRSLTVDRILRTVGLAYWAKQAEKRFKTDDPAYYAIYKAFADGVNDYVRNSVTLPLDFYLVWSNFQVWQVYDSMAINSLLNWGQSTDLGGQYIRSFLASNYSMEQIDAFLPFKDAYVLNPEAVIVNDEQLKKAGLYQEYSLKNWTHTPIRPQQISKLLDVGVVEFANSLDVGASNSWVISGNLTKSGKPILANDPHLDVTIPSEWYQFSLEYTKENGKQILFKGAGVCGALGNFIGRTPYASWGCTNVYTDTQDLYKEKLDQTKSNYFFEGQWRKLRVRKEVIKVKDQPDLQFEVKLTHRGPIINHVYFWQHIFEVKQPLSLSWAAAHSRYQFAIDGLQFIEIDNYKDLVSHLNNKFNDASPMNMIYITNDGHIGLQVIGSFPVALDQEELGGYIKDGTTGKHDWIDIIKGRERLHISDPEKGYIVTANNRLTTKNFRDGRYASNWLITARAIRISEIIQHKIDRGHKLTVEDSKQIQLDTVDVFCRRMVSHLKTLNSEFRRLFDEWDCDFKPNSSKASIYSMFMWKLQMRLRPADIPIAGHPFFNQYTYRYILDTSTDDKEELQNLEGALKQAKVQLEEFFMSANINSWLWGKLHLDFMQHRPFSHSPLARIFEKNSPGRGNENTPNVAQMKGLSDGDWRCDHRAGIRMVLTYQPGQSEWIIDSGSSELIFSPHYDDQHHLFINDKYAPFQTLNTSIRDQDSGL